MKETPLLFKGDMVRGLLRDDEPKTQTRRLAKFKPIMPGDQPNFDCSGIEAGQVCTGSISSGWCLYSKRGSCWNQLTRPLHSPYGHKGDRIWVKETWAENPDYPGSYLYRADRGGDYQGEAQGFFKWKSSMFMSRVTSRITLELTEEPRIERACHISALDCLAEGYPFSKTKTPDVPNPHDPHEWYEELFKSINGPDSWLSWVWVLTFKRIKP